MKFIAKLAVVAFCASVFAAALIPTTVRAQDTGGHKKMGMHSKMHAMAHGKTMGRKHHRKHHKKHKMGRM